MPRALFFSTALTLAMMTGCTSPSANNFLSLSGGELAKMLNFQLDRVEPRLNLAIPLDRSSVDFTIYLKVENTTGNPLTALSFAGALELEQGGTSHYLGGISINDTISLPSRGTALFPITLSLGYNTVRSAWGPLTSAATTSQASVWRLSGNMGMKINKVTLFVPVNLSKATGR